MCHHIIAQVSGVSDRRCNIRLIRFPVRFMHRHGRFFVFYQPVCCEWSRSSDNAAPTLGLADSFGDVWPNGFVTRAASCDEWCRARRAVQGSPAHSRVGDKARPSTFPLSSRLIFSRNVSLSAGWNRRLDAVMGPALSEQLKWLPPIDDETGSRR